MKEKKKEKDQDQPIKNDSLRKQWAKHFHCIFSESAGLKTPLDDLSEGEKAGWYAVAVEFEKRIEQIEAAMDKSIEIKLNAVLMRLALYKGVVPPDDFEKIVRQHYDMLGIKMPLDKKSEDCGGKQ